MNVAKWTRFSFAILSRNFFSIVMAVAARKYGICSCAYCTVNLVCVSCILYASNNNNCYKCLHFYTTSNFYMVVNDACWYAISIAFFALSYTTTAVGFLFSVIPRVRVLSHHFNNVIWFSFLSILSQCFFSLYSVVKLHKDLLFGSSNNWLVVYC